MVYKEKLPGLAVDKTEGSALPVKFPLASVEHPLDFFP